MRRVYRGLDRAGWLSALLKWFRVNLPPRRGMLVLAAIGLTLISLCVHVAWLATGSVWVGVCGFGLLHIAIIVGFVGLLLAEALGRGYRE